MMICAETFYENELKGKSPAQIKSVIRKLKQEIGRLKNLAEHPNYTPKMCPTERVKISCMQDYLKRAKEALEEAGERYTPSVAEQKAIDFDDNIPNICKIVFSIGGYFQGNETRTCVVDENNVFFDIEHSLIQKPINIEHNEPLDKICFLEAFKDLHVGEWRRNYSPKRFDMFILDGTQWSLEIYYSNGRRPVRIYGDNVYPYNFNRLLDLFGSANK